MFLNLLSKEVEFVWTDKCQSTFADLKQKVSQASILRDPDWSVPFHISSDASNIAIGVVLGQKEDSKPYVIYFISKNMSPAKLNLQLLKRNFLLLYM